MQRFYFFFQEIKSEPKKNIDYYAGHFLLPYPIVSDFADRGPYCKEFLHDPTVHAVDIDVFGSFQQSQAD